MKSFFIVVRTMLHQLKFWNWLVAQCDFGTPLHFITFRGTPKGCFFFNPLSFFKSKQFLHAGVTNVLIVLYRLIYKYFKIITSRRILADQLLNDSFLGQREQDKSITYAGN